MSTPESPPLSSHPPSPLFPAPREIWHRLVQREALIWVPTATAGDENRSSLSEIRTEKFEVQNKGNFGPNRQTGKTTAIIHDKSLLSHK